MILLWLALGFLAAGQLMFNTHYQSDMSAFMPDQTQGTLAPVSRSLKEGPAARLWLIALKDASPARLATASKQLSQRLRDSGDFSQVLNGEGRVDEATQTLVFRYRYLLDERIDADYFSSDSLRGFLQQRLEELSSPLSSITKQWLASDPTAAMLTFLQQQQGAISLTLYDGVWLSKDHSQALIMAESHAPGFELDAQQAIKDRLLAAFENSGMTLVLSGAPEIALQTRHAIKSDAQRLSVIASLFMLLFMAWVYRSARKVLLTALPLGGGILMAAAVVSWWFGDVHAITLAFGITVLGVAVDYPIHLLSHGRANESLSVTMQRIWPTLRLGVISTLLGYLAMALTDFSGLAQLGVFSMAGLLTAALITRTLLPALAAGGGNGTNRLRGVGVCLNKRTPPLLVGASLLLVLGAAVYIAQQPAIWSDDIARLSPIPDELRQQDRQLRQQLSGPASRYLITTAADSLELLLQRQETLMAVLDEAVRAGEIQRYTLAAQLLPSQQLQRQRQVRLVDEKTLRQHLNTALEGLPFRAQTFAPFVREVGQARTMALLDYDDFQGTPFQRQLDGLLSFSATGVGGIVRLSGVDGSAGQTAALQSRLQAANIRGVRFVDIKQSSSEAVGQFRAEALMRIVWAGALIVLALWFGLRDFRRVAKVILPVAGAVTVAAAVPLAMGVPLNLFNLVSLLLVAGIGLDYSLFFSRRQTDQISTLHALLVCCISTVTVFAILSSSAIPVLYAIGMTVFSGVLAAFVLSWVFSRN